MDSLYDVKKSSLMSSQQLEAILTKVKAKISEQGPLEYFVHHNPLHHLENLSAFEAFKQAAVDYDTAAFMTESYYKNQYLHGRIARQKLLESVEQFLQRQQSTLEPELLLRILLADHGGCTDYRDEVKLLQREYASSRKCFFDKIIEQETGININYYIADVVYRFFSAYFDFGSSHWQLDFKGKGIWHAFRRLHYRGVLFESKYYKNLARSIQSYRKLMPAKICLVILSSLEIDADDIEDYVFSRLFNFKGWIGFIKSLMNRPDWLNGSEAVPDLMEALTVLLVCEKAAIDTFYVTKISAPTLSYTAKHGDEFLNYYVDYCKKDKVNNHELMRLLPFLTDLDRQQLWHVAFEQSFYQTVLPAFSHVAQQTSQSRQAKYQVVCCIDDREESFRRHLEADKDCETFGTAGHFGLNLLYKSYFSDHERALCPVNNRGEYRAYEEVHPVEKHKRRAAIVWCELQWLSALSSRAVIPGILQSFVSVLTHIAPFCLDLFMPKLTYTLRERASRALGNALKTTIVYDDPNHGIGFDDRLIIAEAFLKSTGLVDHLSPYIILMGHGSSSLNNPHTAAYDCGACGGGRGGPNARIMALILNDQKIRQGLQKRGITVPDSTLFIGAYHNTCSDDVTYYDMPVDTDSKLQLIQEKILRAAEFNAKERCRRFVGIPRGKTPHFYHQEVQARSIDFCQTRPEYGHSSNAICVVGPRHLSRQLFLDRRAFLVSYDRQQDVDSQLLLKLLATALPVCAGINLEYYFSFIDNEVYGCGTKLPHNVNGLVGVINGFMSDLQLGLTWQMVEIHEPIRLLLIICASVDAMKVLLTRDEPFTQLIKNGWVELAVYDDEVKAMFNYVEGDFVRNTDRYVGPQYFRDDPIIVQSRECLQPGEIVS